MAHIVGDEVFSKPRYYPTSYPWDEWFDGQAREMVIGEDFVVELGSFVRAVQAAGKLRDLRIRTRKTGPDRVVIQALR